MKKKIVLLGDSIRLWGYGPIVEQTLKDEYEIFQPEDNCRFVKYTLRMIFDLHKQIKDADVIHFNCGHWDVTDLFGDGELFSTDEEYAANLKRIITQLKKITPNVIFATTTPVCPDYPYNKCENIERFNRIATETLAPYGVVINDLYTPVAENYKLYLSDDGIHLSEQGSRLCATLTVDAIKNFK